MDGISEYKAFLALHEAQLKLACVPDYLWHSVFIKLRNQIFDAGEMFMIALDEEGNKTVIVTKTEGCLCSDANNVFLIDHAWTFEAKDAFLQLNSFPVLLNRMTALMNVSDQLSLTEQLNEVYRVMWKYARTYTRVIEANDLPTTFWYILDEFGSAIVHSSTPNFRAVPIFYHSEEIAYTLLFPIRDTEESEEINVDFVEGCKNDDVRTREALLVPWTQQSFAEDELQLVEPTKEYFLTGAHTDYIPDSRQEAQPRPPVLKVYTEYSFVRDYLTHPNFVVVDSEREADILWLTRHFYDFKQLQENQPGVFINQFPCERVVTTKDLLAIVARRAQDWEEWLPETYNLVTELPEFVGVFQRREAAGLDNHWICKPWNLARALDTTVSDNLSQILRLPFTGPKIVQKYVNKPVLYNRLDIPSVKFDIRYVVLLESVNPLRLYCYKKFFLRFANKPFELNDLWDYDKHFTVMNYRGEDSLHHLDCEEFKTTFAEQYPAHSWETVEGKILHALRETFVAASQEPPPKGLAAFSQSRALYAADLVLSWKNDDMQPLLLEVNFGPDCERACLYYPEFYNDIFLLLFSGESHSEKFHVL